ncbi:hypothetical protein N657DRAFT_369205 [Parathielavia appendiculata]|uniref:Uncharacterized protein n=1 Tax=Parathielavia appendiculata TaxID=2587402 RepID=A0AAN6TQ07_9PEZI|nr:hypothetical protein N657DRAFT_369205 [Parathielavia appendiculata]
MDGDVDSWRVQRTLQPHCLLLSQDEAGARVTGNISATSLTLVNPSSEPSSRIMPRSDESAVETRCRKPGGLRVVDADKMSSCFWFRPWSLAGSSSSVTGMCGRIQVVEHDFCSWRGSKSRSRRLSGVRGLLLVTCEQPPPGRGEYLEGLV